MRDARMRDARRARIKKYELFRRLNKQHNKNKLEKMNERRLDATRRSRARLRVPRSHFQLHHGRAENLQTLAHFDEFEVKGQVLSRERMVHVQRQTVRVQGETERARVRETRGDRRQATGDRWRTRMPISSQAS